MDKLLRGGPLQSMKLALTLTTVEVQTDEVVEIDAAEGATNNDFTQVSMLKPGRTRFWSIPREAVGRPLC